MSENYNPVLEGAKRENYSSIQEKNCMERCSCGAFLEDSGICPNCYWKIFKEFLRDLKIPVVNMTKSEIEVESKELDYENKEITITVRKGEKLYLERYNLEKVEENDITF